MIDSQEQALLAGVIALRRDDAPRYGYADYCLDSDDPALRARGEFVRLQLAYHYAPACVVPRPGGEGCPPGGRMCAACQNRSRLRLAWQALLHWPEWLAVTQLLPIERAGHIALNMFGGANNVIVARGFVDQLTVTTSQWSHVAATARAVTPLTRVAFTDRSTVPCAHSSIVGYRVMYHFPGGVYVVPRNRLPNDFGSLPGGAPAQVLAVATAIWPEVTFSYAAAVYPGEGVDDDMV